MDRRDVEISNERSAKIATDDVCVCGAMLMAGGFCLDCDVKATPAVPVAPTSKTRKRSRPRKPREKKVLTLADRAARVAGGGR